MHDDTPQLPLFTIASDDLPPIVPITSKNTKDLTGQRFGRLLVLGYVGSTTRWRTQWLCQCECGKCCVIRGGNLRNGTQSCGCLHREQLSAMRKTHGASGTREHRIWRAMITRCENPGQPHYSRYGGRGIGVCDEWRHSFEQFIADMGPCPGPRHSIDRINNDLGYSPENCRWATDIEQANNHSNNHFLEFQGERLTISEWARKLGISDRTLRSRARKGLSVEEILSTSVKCR